MTQKGKSRRGGLARLSNARSRSISPKNPAGGAGQGGLAETGTGTSAARDPGRGWKISPSVKIPAGTEVDRMTGPARFHACFRRANPSPSGEDHLILDTHGGVGHYVGTYLGITLFCVIITASPPAYVLSRYRRRVLQNRVFSAAGRNDDSNSGDCDSHQKWDDVFAILFFLRLQKQFISGLTAGSLKG